MSMRHRSGTILKPASGQATHAAFAVGYTVTAYEVGAISSATATGAVIAVHAGHGFAAGDKLLIDPGGANTFSGTDVVQSTTATSVTMGQSYSVTNLGVIINLGPDTGTSSPAYDGSGVAIYNDPTGSSTISNSRVTTSSVGEYSYYYQAAHWALIRDGNGTAVDSDLSRGVLEIDISATDGSTTIPGALKHTGSTLGFRAQAASSMPAAYTQTYSAANRTVSAVTAVAIAGTAGGTADGTLTTLPTLTDSPASADALRDDIVANLIPALKNNFADLVNELNALRLDVIDVKQNANAMINDRQTDGLATE